MAVFSDTTNKNGLIQKFEFWARLPDGTVTGTLLKQVTDRLNVATEYIMPLLLSYNDRVRWDDVNHGDRPIGYVDIVSGQNDYTIAVDENSLDILNITSVRVKQSGGEYQKLTRVLLDDPRAESFMSPASTQSGIPTAYIENGNTIFFDVKPNYALTDGIEVFFSREQYYFLSTDTTKEPGIPKMFHELIVLYAVRDWLSVNRTDDVNLLTIVNDSIVKMRNDLSMMIASRNPTKVRMIPRYHSSK